MAFIRVLDNSTIHNLLINLSRQETLNFLHIFEQTLLEFHNKRMSLPAYTQRGQPAQWPEYSLSPFTSTPNIGAKIIIDPGPDASGKIDPQSGVIVLCDEKGVPSDVLSAGEVTG
ncbi:hypothetical protein BDW75DRAFT_243446 [Aspergillus navahoensis]